MADPIYPDAFSRPDHLELQPQNRLGRTRTKRCSYFTHCLADSQVDLNWLFDLCVRRLHQPRIRHQHLAMDIISAHRPRHVRMDRFARRGRIHHVQREALERMEDSVGKHRHLAHSGLRRRVHEPLRFQNGTGQLVHDFDWRDVDRNIRFLSNNGITEK